MKIKIKVTKEILRKSANCHEVHNCAIAQAVREIFPGAMVGLETIASPSLGFIDSLPDEAQEFVLDFDHNTPEKRLLMPELSFQIDVSNEVINKIGIDEVHRILSESKTLELV